MAGLSDDAELIIGELAVNVVRAATGADGRPRYVAGRLPVMWMRLLSDRAWLRVEVWDDVPLEWGVPRRRVAGENDESGRGLELVGALCKDWGWEPAPSPATGGGAAKRVWALLGG